MSKEERRRISTYVISVRTCQKKQIIKMACTRKGAIRVKSGKKKNCHVRYWHPYVPKETNHKIAMYEEGSGTCQKRKEEELPRT